MAGPGTAARPSPASRRAAWVAAAAGHGWGAHPRPAALASHLASRPATFAHLPSPTHLPTHLEQLGIIRLGL